MKVDVDEVKADRDRWREIAEKLALYSKAASCVGHMVLGNTHQRCKLDEALKEFDEAGKK